MPSSRPTSSAERNGVALSLGTPVGVRVAVSIDCQRAKAEPVRWGKSPLTTPAMAFSHDSVHGLRPGPRGRPRKARSRTTFEGFRGGRSGVRAPHKANRLRAWLGRQGEGSSHTAADIFPRRVRRRRPARPGCIPGRHQQWNAASSRNIEGQDQVDDEVRADAEGRPSVPSRPDASLKISNSPRGGCPWGEKPGQHRADKEHRAGSEHPPAGKQQDRPRSLSFGESEIQERDGDKGHPRGAQQRARVVGDFFEDRRKPLHPRGTDDQCEASRSRYRFERLRNAGHPVWVGSIPARIDSCEPPSAVNPFKRQTPGPVRWTTLQKSR